MAATELKQTDKDVLVVDKGRGVGGRMATRRMDGARLDHGAQFFTVRSPEINERLSTWKKAGLIQEWYHSLEGDTCWRGNTGMTDLPKALASELNLLKSTRIERIEYLDNSWKIYSESDAVFVANSLIISAPLPQACQLLRSQDSLIPANDLVELDAVRYTRCLAALITLKGPSAIPAPGITKIDHPDVETLIDNHQKGISREYAVTVHSTPAYAEKHWDLSNDVRLPPVLDAVREYLGSEIKDASMHRWGFSKTINPIERSHYFNKAKGLALAGDGFGGGRIESAALSGIAAALSILSA